MVKFYLKWGGEYLKTHPNCKYAKKYKDEYEFFLVDTFRNKIKGIEQKIKGNMFDNGIDCKQFLEDYFNIKL